MTEEELFKVYIKRELCAHCGFPLFCKDCYDIATAKRHYLAGLEAGKGMAELDIATVAYMQGAERYKPKWHKVANGDLPKKKKEYWCKVYYSESEETFNAFLWFDPTNKDFRHLEDIGETAKSIFNVKEWCELQEE